MNNTVNTMDLNGEWSLHQVGGKLKLQARLPGVVHYALLKNQLVDDPYYRMNEADQQWIAESAWEYERRFTLTKTQLKAERIVLNADGIEGIAEIRVNGRLLGRTDNAFRQYRFDCKPLLEAGNNTIQVHFSPIKPELERRSQGFPWFVGNAKGNGPCDPPYRNFYRGCQCYFGWDWGLCMIPQGVRNGIRLEFMDGCKILYLTHRQEHRKNGTVRVPVTAWVDAATDGEAELTVECAGEKAFLRTAVQPGENRIDIVLNADKPDLWWPLGQGTQALYELKVEIRMGDDTDVSVQKIGFRKLDLVREPDPVGESFYFRVNGVPVFAKGNNWIPGDVFDARFDDDDLEWLLRSAAAANNNIIRIWGGGLYERERFYELCDQLGIMVWQDFMFACALYPTNPEFLENVRAEVRHQIRRLSHHPSLALWCGNNENEQCLDWNRGTDNVNTKINATLYDQLYIQTILPLVEELDPDRTFWPSSPSNGVRAYGDPQEETRGDVHYWQVWHGGKPFTEYLKVKPRFSSEFGFQSFASPETMDTVTAPEDRNIASRVFEWHQRSGQGNLTILSHIARQFLIPTDYENMLYVSQALQALSIKTACEHWRRIKPHNMGTIIWQINDIWPVASWSSIEYGGRWKMLHYQEKKFYAPLLVSSVETEQGLEIWATSDVNHTLTGKLRFSLLDFDGKTVRSSEISVRLKAMESRRIVCHKTLTGTPDAFRQFAHFSLDCGEFQSENQHFFAPFKHLELKPPKLTTSLKERNGTVVLSLKADTLTPFVWIRHGKTLGTWSDNGMHLVPGKTVELTFTPRKGKADLRTIQKSLVIHHLQGSAFPK